MRIRQYKNHKVYESCFRKDIFTPIEQESASTPDTPLSPG